MTTHFVLGKVITVYCLEPSETNTMQHVMLRRRSTYI